MSLASGQSYDCSNVIEATLTDMGKTECHFRWQWAVQNTYYDIEINEICSVSVRFSTITYNHQTNTNGNIKKYDFLNIELLKFHGIHGTSKKCLIEFQGILWNFFSWKLEVHWNSMELGSMENVHGIPWNFGSEIPWNFMEFEVLLLKFHGIPWNHRCCSNVVQKVGNEQAKNIYVSNSQLFYNDRPWILPWIKAISNKLDIIIHVIALQLFDHCDVIHNRLWRHPQNVNHVNRTSETRGRVLFWYLSPSWKNTQITLSQNQFSTRLHTIFFLHVYSAVMCRI